MSYNSYTPQTSGDNEPPPPDYNDYSSVPQANVTFRYTSTDGEYIPLQRPPIPTDEPHQPYIPAGVYQHQPPALQASIGTSSVSNSQQNTHHVLDLDDFLVQPDEPEQTYDNFNLNTNATGFDPYNPSNSQASGTQQQSQQQTHLQPLQPLATQSINSAYSNTNSYPTTAYDYNPNANPYAALPSQQPNFKPIGLYHGSSNVPSSYIAPSSLNVTTLPFSQQPLPIKPNNSTASKNVILDEDDPDYDPFLALNAVHTLSIQPTKHPQQQHQHQQQQPLTPQKSQTQAQISSPTSSQRTSPTVDVTTLIQQGQLMLPFDDFECIICAEMIFVGIFNQEFQELGCFPGDLEEFRDQCPALTLSTCLHTFCFTCLKEYVTNFIENELVQADVKRVPCMDSGCDSWFSQTELRAILSHEDYARFEQQQLEWSSLGLKNMYKCITPDCTAIIEKTGDLIGDERTGRFNPKLICPQCNIAQCVQCGIKWHMDQTCKEYQTKQAEGEAIKNSALLSKAANFDATSPRFRQCPQCKIMIEKEAGCDKVKCLCGYGMCWRCGSPGARCDCTKGNHVFYDNVTRHGTRDISNR